MKTTKGLSLANNVRRYTRKTVAGLLSVVFFAACCPIAFAAEDPDVPLTPDELAGMTHEEIAAISQEQSDATLNKMAQLWQDGEMGTLDEYYAALGFATTYEEYEAQWEEPPASEEPSIQPMWSSDTDNDKEKGACHSLITQSGFLVYLAARNLTFGGASIGYTLADMQTLATQSEQPDKEDDQANLFYAHFYDPDTGLNYLHRILPDSSSLCKETARTKAEDYYAKAKDGYNSNRAQALQDLAYCLHFVQDAGEPHHATNKTVFDSSNHSDFEKEASAWLYDKVIEYDLEENFDYDISTYNGFYARSVGESVHELAVAAKGTLGAAESSVEGTRKLAAYFMLGNSMQYTAGILYKFAKDVRMY